MTNYDAVIYQLIESLKDEKTIPAEYRNALISDGRRWQMQIRGALTLTKIKPEIGRYGNETHHEAISGSETILGTTAQATATQNTACSCPAGGLRRDCVVHGRAA